MIRVSQTVGRLAEIRMTSPITSEDLATMQRDVAAILDRTQGRIVVCADLSGATVLPSDLADRIARFFRASNARLERTAILVGGGATFFLQIERLLREGGSRPDTPPPRDPASGRTPGSDPHARRPPEKTGDHLTRRISERRAFRTPAEASTWLADSLTLEERARLSLFLDSPRAP